MSLCKDSGIHQIVFCINAEYDAESLNNEETIGNVTMGRKVVLKDGTERHAISGLMLKYIQLNELYQLVTPDQLCDSCKVRSSLRNGKLKNIDHSLSPSGNRSKNCIICDIAGFMNVEDDKSKQHSVIKNGWAIGSVHSKEATVQHVRFDHVNGNKKKVGKEGKDKQADDLSSSDSIF